MITLPMAENQSSTRSYKKSRYNHIVKLEDGQRLLYNSVTNAMSVIDPEHWDYYQSFQHGRAIQRSNELDSHLLEAGYIVPESMDEIAHLKQMHLSEKYDGSAWSLTLCPTIACNFGCDYCFELHQPGKMSPAVQEAVVAMLRARAPKLRTFHVTWYGGEPTIAWDVVRDLSRALMEVCDQYGIAYTAAMISNGYLLNDERVDELETLRIGVVQITIDGPPEYHDSRRALLSGKGTFSTIVKNMRRFIGKPSEVSIRVNVDERNKDAVFHLMDVLVDEGLAGHDNINVYFAVVTSTTAPSQNVAGFCLTHRTFADIEVEYIRYAMARGLATAPFPQLNFVGCIAIRPEEYVIQADGEVHKCWNTVGQPQYSLGNILDPDRNPLHAPAYQRWMNYDAFDGKLACTTCTWLPTCMGGCPYHSVYQDQKPDQEVYLECTSFKFNHKKTLPLYFAEAAKAGTAPRGTNLCTS